MSRNVGNALDEKEHEERVARENAFNKRFNKFFKSLEAAGIDAYDLEEWVLYVVS